MRFVLLSALALLLASAPACQPESPPQVAPLSTEPRYTSRGRVELSNGRVFVIGFDNEVTGKLQLQYLLNGKPASLGTKKLVIRSFPVVEEWILHRIDVGRYEGLPGKATFVTGTVALGLKIEPWKEGEEPIYIMHKGNPFTLIEGTDEVDLIWRSISGVPPGAGDRLHDF